MPASQRKKGVYFPFKIFYVQNFYNTQSLYFPIKTSAIKRKYPTLIVRIFLVSARTHSISRYIHIQTLRIHKRNVPRFLQHGTYHVVVRRGSHFCQSPKGGGSGVFSLKRKGGPTLFWGKNTKIPQPSPPPRKNVPSLIIFLQFIKHRRRCSTNSWLCACVEVELNWS